METSTRSLSINDPLYLAIKGTIDSLNQINELIDNNKDRIHSKIFYSIALIFGVITAVFIEFFNILILLVFGNVLLVLLIIFAKDFYHRRRKLATEQDKIKKGLEDLGIKIKD
ncbi:hypothetical protein HYT25_02665 [Candidatus Pacearchaeota archaeon]|nr:hypothetical protein [Candidatus Pacearchaeota archaeon]